MKSAASAAQFDTLCRMATTAEPLRYFKGGYWSVDSAWRAVPGARWATSIGTVRAMEKRGWIREFHDDDCDSKGPIIYCLRYWLTDAGVAMAQSVQP